MTSGTPHSGLRVVVAECAADGEGGRGARIACALRDAGHEVVHTGPLQSPDQVVEASIQEDADLIGLATEGADPGLRATLVGLLEARGVDDIEVLVGSDEITRWVAEHFAQDPITG
ncbi:MAG: isobutyryl-CoA mutase small subunit [Nocardioides sp.]|jgi:methylmalonyl-CoA mutase C-terminal domain/subunit|uniref:methylmalonyl-CoA mutase n=1 Tax=Nocardioides sp. TaxID=35761 RepID=UPI0026233A3B|nr:methylmalonyl-CoA mutase [Nocardioides sp.]MCW2834334.1 isobutyryl-CoA mutase small subunit [Nocardioides sp.]